MSLVEKLSINDAECVADEEDYDDHLRYVSSLGLPQQGLYDQLGSWESFSAAVDMITDRICTDPLLGTFFKGLDKNGLARQMAVVVGGSLTGRLLYSPYQLWLIHRQAVVPCKLQLLACLLLDSPRHYPFTTLVPARTDSHVTPKVTHGQAAQVPRHVCDSPAQQPSVACSSTLTAALGVLRRHLLPGGPPLSSCDMPAGDSPGPYLNSYTTPPGGGQEPPSCTLSPAALKVATQGPAAGCVIAGVGKDAPLTALPSGLAPRSATPALEEAMAICCLRSEVQPPATALPAIAGSDNRLGVSFNVLEGLGVGASPDTDIGFHMTTAAYDVQHPSPSSAPAAEASVTPAKATVVAAAAAVRAVTEAGQGTCGRLAGSKVVEMAADGDEAGSQAGQQYIRPGHVTALASIVAGVLQELGLSQQLVATAEGVVLSCSWLFSRGDVFHDPEGAQGAWQSQHDTLHCHSVMARQLLQAGGWACDLGPATSYALGGGLCCSQGETQAPAATLAAGAVSPLDTAPAHLLQLDGSSMPGCPAGSKRSQAAGGVGCRATAAHPIRAAGGLPGANAGSGPMCLHAVGVMGSEVQAVNLKPSNGGVCPGPQRVEHGMRWLCGRGAGAGARPRLHGHVRWRPLLRARQGHSHPPHTGSQGGSVSALPSSACWWQQQAVPVYGGVSCMGRPSAAAWPQLLQKSSQQHPHRVTLFHGHLPDLDHLSLFCIVLGVWCCAIAWPPCCSPLVT
ncbi:hypothetical protein HaLaN_24662 [Haematococcus lacustris]|uniref:Uncharacterized protein n=1 Tax=Haematococcus lacustris TaxID=44745 RepID=A0A699ZZ01_HAELA|nr:hypothetical protein HaLaN_24662 [Haematococcus lacustris]